jgi:hypothetical protein
VGKMLLHADSNETNCRASPYQEFLLHKMLYSSTQNSTALLVCTCVCVLGISINLKFHIDFELLYQFRKSLIVLAPD